MGRKNKVGQPGTELRNVAADETQVESAAPSEASTERAYRLRCLCGMHVHVGEDVQDSVF